MKNKTIAGLLALFLGAFGIHKFYLNQKNGIWYILFFWTLIPSIIALVEGIRYLTMPEEEFNKKYNEKIAGRASLEDLEKLHSLKEKGAITEDEYKERKSEIFDKPKGIKKEISKPSKSWINRNPVLTILIIFIGFPLLLSLGGSIYRGVSSKETKTQEIKVVDPVKIENDKKRLEELKTLFNYKYDEFTKVGWYENKNQTTENSFNRTYIKVVVRDDGYSYLEDQYYASDWLFHTKVKVLIDGLDKVYESVEVPRFKENNKTEIGSNGNVWENISYIDGGDMGIIKAITENVDKEIKVRFVGKDYYKDITLTKTDKQAIKDSYELANLLKESN